MIGNAIIKPSDKTSLDLCLLASLTNLDLMLWKLGLLKALEVEALKLLVFLLDILLDIFVKELIKKPNWSLLGIGGYFAYLGYKSNLDSISMAKKLLADQNILTIPGDMFFPKSKNLFIKEKRSIRIAFANSTYEEIIDLFKRLRNFVL